MDVFHCNTCGHIPHLPGIDYRRYFITNCGHVSCGNCSLNGKKVKVVEICIIEYIELFLVLFQVEKNNVQCVIWLVKSLKLIKQLILISKHFLWIQHKLFLKHINGLIKLQRFKKHKAETFKF